MKALLAALLLGVLPLAARAATTPCVFCDIVAGQRQQESVVYRDEICTAFLSIGQRNPGHVLIVPNAHVENFMAVPDATMHHLTDVAQVIIAAIKRTDLKCDGIMLQMNSGQSAGQAVFHAHLHIIPRFAGDDAGAPVQSAAVQQRAQTGQAEAQSPPKRAGDPFPPEVLAPIAAKIRAALEVGRVVPTSHKGNALGSARFTIEDHYELPSINTEVPLSRIKEICAHYGLQDLWAKIEKNPPPHPFKSDGCTGWFDDWKGVSLYPAGFLHDLKYWAGYPGEDVERLTADAELMTDVAHLLKSTTMAETMFSGVRVGGNEKFKLAFSWGFGRAKP